MNKLLIVVLLVCLVSVHAFVKRDAPPAKPSELDALAKQIQDALANMGDTFKSNVNVEQLQKLGNEFVGGLNNAIKQLTDNSATQPPK